MDIQETFDAINSLVPVTRYYLNPSDYRAVLNTTLKSYMIVVEQMSQDGLLDVDEVKYRRIEYFFHGKKFCRINEFYNKYHHLPRPIIVDKENNLLDGYNAFMFAKEFGIQQIPVIRLENVILIIDKSEDIED